MFLNFFQHRSIGAFPRTGSDRYTHIAINARTTHDIKIFFVVRARPIFCVIDYAYTPCFEGLWIDLFSHPIDVAFRKITTLKFLICN